MEATRVNKVVNKFFIIIHVHACVGGYINTSVYLVTVTDYNINYV